MSKKPSSKANEPPADLHFGKIKLKAGTDGGSPLYKAKSGLLRIECKSSVWNKQRPWEAAIGVPESGDPWGFMLMARGNSPQKALDDLLGKLTKHTADCAVILGDVSGIVDGLLPIDPVRILKKKKRVSKGARRAKLC
jgi:hypothetical protein